MPVSALAGARCARRADIGSGLLRPDPLLPDEPDATTALREGASVVTCSARQAARRPAGRPAARRRRRGGVPAPPPAGPGAARRQAHPRGARGDRARARATPTHRYLHADPEQLRRRAERLAGGSAATSCPRRVRSAAAPPPGWGCPAGPSPCLPRTPRSCGSATRASSARVERGRCLVDLRCVEEHDDAALVAAIRRPGAVVHVVATAGHVDHGKSTLVRALTGMEPDRWAEERRRGMTIDLGYAWTSLPSGEELAFVDVPGHQRFIGNMLAGLGPAPAVLFVVAADEGWRRQSAEHLAAVDALGLTHGLLAVTRSDLADPGARLGGGPRAAGHDVARRRSRPSRCRRHGPGPAELRAALAALVARLPPPDLDARIRLWVDRSFTIQGSGTVVTGTLAAGTLRGGRRARARRRAASGSAACSSSGSRASRSPRSPAWRSTCAGCRGEQVTARQALLTPGAWRTTSLLDVRLGAPATTCPPSWCCTWGRPRCRCTSARSAAGTPGSRCCTRCRSQPGDRAILRDPGRQPVADGVLVLDAEPTPLRRRGAAARRAASSRRRRPPGPAHRGTPPRRRPPRRTCRPRAADGRPVAPGSAR